MIKREITKELLDASREYPVITIFGPRQSGKTTLVKMTFPDKPYYSFEDPDIRIAVETDPRNFLNNLPQGAVLDEIQRLPQLLSYIQGIVDRTPLPGMFVITGSHQPELHQTVSQSLAGRTAILNLLPFSLREVKEYNNKISPYELIYKGMFPRIHKENLKPNRFYNGYIQTYVERDVRALINLKNLRTFQQFLLLLAGRIGQVINFTSLSNDIGVSSTTIKNWLSVLKASFVVFELPPYFENIGKRVIKSPKLYFCDTGLISFLLGLESSIQAERDPLRGNLYENLIILELLKFFHNSGKRPDFYFYRDTHGNEVDIIIRKSRKLIPIEIKSAATFTKDFFKGMDRFMKTTREKCEQGYVLYNGAEEFNIKGKKIFNLFIHYGFQDLGII
jgi:predicted AAA+ superfamily ATPase